MSAPIAAGSAAVVRQYYTDGYYPLGGWGAVERCSPGQQGRSCCVVGSWVLVMEVEGCVQSRHCCCGAADF